MKSVVRPAVRSAVKKPVEPREETSIPSEAVIFEVEYASTVTMGVEYASTVDAEVEYG